jgi:hypothetical protein
MIALAALLLVPGCGSLIVTQQSVESLATRRGFTWIEKPIDGFVIYVEPSSIAATEIEAVQANARRARESVCDRGELPSLVELTRRFDGQPTLVSYPAAGSLVRYLHETHGLQAVRQVWDGGRDALPSATGMDRDAIETAWLAVVDQADATGIEYAP